MRAEALVKLLASRLKTDVFAVLKIIREVTVDPYSEFIYASWARTDIEDSQQQRS